MTKTSTRAIAAAIAISLVAACGGDDDDPAVESGTESSTTSPDESFTAQVASYDLAADAPQRFIVGLLAGEGGLVVGGTVELSFSYLGEGKDGSPSTSGSAADIKGVTARFTTVADGTAPTTGPQPGSGPEQVGVYEATGVSFGRAGFWEATVTAPFGGEERKATAAFEVLPTAAIPAAGDMAPRTENLLPGAADAPVKAVDSRAEDDGTVPDPALHRLTVAQAIATGEPTVVVISTPVFCVSRFCGPITDTVDAIAAEQGDQANFVHIEVWRDYEGKAVNKGAAEWIYPNPQTDASEPWVFLVDGSGRIVRRWDNVTNGADLRAALAELT
jgi:hypothetical protein